MKNDDQMPIIGIRSEDSGITYYPLYKKNTKGEWELADKSFRKLFMRHAVFKKPVTTLCWKVRTL